MPHCQPKPGQNGVFVFEMNKSKGLCTIPVTIVSVTEDMGNMKIRCQDLMGVGFMLHMSDWDGFKAIAPDGRGGYTMPKGFKWVPMEGFDRVSNSPLDYAALGMGVTKVASAKHIIATGYNQYALKGLDKYARALEWDPTNLHEYQAKFILASLGMNETKIAAAMKQASRSGAAEVRVNELPLQSEKIAAAIPQARKMVKVASDMKCNLIKVASYMENSQSVDAILALNFVNSDNLAKFVGKIPSLKAAVSNLASLIIASRLGYQEIPEHSAVTAMHRITDVINGLEGLRAQEEMQ
jgi:hypothetical protein